MAKTERKSDETSRRSIGEGGWGGGQQVIVGLGFFAKFARAAFPNSRLQMHPVSEVVPNNEKYTVWRALGVANKVACEYTI